MGLPPISLPGRMRNDAFALIVLLSASLHGGAAWYFHVNYQPPEALPTRQGYVSIDLRASIAAAPAKKPPTPPERIEKLPPPQREPEPLPPPEQVAEILPPPERQPEKLPEPEKVEQKTPPKIESPAPSNPSLGSKASQGTITEEPVDIGTNPQPPWPKADYLAGREGTVKLFIRIDATGRVVFARVETSSGHPGLDQSALTTIYAWRFRPARQNGVPVMAECYKPFEFFFRRNP